MMWFKKSDDSHEFRPILAEIEDCPVNPLGRVTFWIIIAVILFLCLWLYFGEVDVVVTGRGKVIPDGQIKVVQPLDTGVIRRIDVRPGDFVQKGQLLVEIDPSATAPALESLQEQALTLEIEVERLETMLAGRPFVPDEAQYGAELVLDQIGIFESRTTAQHKLIEAKRDELRKTLEQMSTAQTEGRRYEALLAIDRERAGRMERVLDIIAHDQYEQLRREIVNNERALDEVALRLNELRHQVSLLKNDLAYAEQSFRSELGGELAEKKRQLTEAQGEIDRVAFVNRKQRLLAPVSGYVNEVQVSTVGGVVTPAQPLLSIVPVDTPLLIEAQVLNKDIGFVEPAMPVTVKVDAFNFQKYGTIEGEVRQVSRDSIKDEQLGDIYRIYVVPHTLELVVEGKPNAVTTGMTVSAEVNVGKRRIIEFFIYPLIKYLDEGMSVI